MCLYMYVYINVCVGVYMCIYVYAYLCMYISMYVLLFIYLFTIYIYYPFISYSIVFVAGFFLVLTCSNLTQKDQSSVLLNVALTILC